MNTGYSAKESHACLLRVPLPTTGTRAEYSHLAKAGLVRNMMRIGIAPFAASHLNLLSVPSSAPNMRRLRLRRPGSSAAGDSAGRLLLGSRSPRSSSRGADASAWISDVIKHQ